MVRPMFLALTVLAFVVTSLSFEREGFTSGGGEISITHDHVRVTLATARKTPMRGDEESYNRTVVTWENDNRPVAEKAIAAIEREVLPRYRKKLSLVAKSFDAQNLKDLSTEGVSRGGYDDASWLLTVDLDLYPGADSGSRAMFVFKTRPSKPEVRRFSRDVQAAALRTVGRKLPAGPSYTAYWLVAEGASPSLLLTAVPLAKLQTTLQGAPWRAPGFETFRRAPALLITTAAKLYITGSSAGFLVANPTAAKFEPGETSVVLQVNGSYLPAMKVQKASRAEALKLIENAVDPSLSPAAAAEQRKRVEDDLDFLATLKPALAQ